MSLSHSGLFKLDAKNYDKQKNTLIYKLDDLVMTLRQKKNELKIDQSWKDNFSKLIKQSTKEDLYNLKSLLKYIEDEIVVQKGKYLSIGWLEVIAVSYLSACVHHNWTFANVSEDDGRDIDHLRIKYGPIMLIYVGSKMFFSSTSMGNVTQLHQMKKLILDYCSEIENFEKSLSNKKKKLFKTECNAHRNRSIKSELVCTCHQH